MNTINILEAAANAAWIRAFLAAEVGTVQPASALHGALNAARLVAWKPGVPIGQADW
jgi:hypothetical protein